ncbi:MAG: cupin domain-containing protein [Bacteroidales bacterium]|jgi:uncharacterized cupin superfamily protein|nr:cupin domain-containing protein [Bacteroidales bacterium]
MDKIKVETFSKDQLKEKGVFSWPVWARDSSRFNWTYADDEECYIIEGECAVETINKTVHLKPGDFVTFKKELECVCDIKKAVKKHYNFP